MKSRWWFHTWILSDPFSVGEYCPQSSWSCLRRKTGHSITNRSSIQSVWRTYSYVTILCPNPCLCWLQKRIKRKEYPSASEFANDVELVFSNALTFNQERTVIWEDALALRVSYRAYLLSIRLTLHFRIISGSSCLIYLSLLPFLNIPSLHIIRSKSRCLQHSPKLRHLLNPLQCSPQRSNCELLLRQSSHPNLQRLPLPRQLRHLPLPYRLQCRLQCRLRPLPMLLLHRPSLNQLQATTQMLPTLLPCNLLQQFQQHHLFLTRQLPSLNLRTSYSVLC